MDAIPSSNVVSPPPVLQYGSAPIIERAPLPMVEVEGREHFVVFVNAAFCRLVQKDRQELLGLPFADIVTNGEKCVPQLDRVYETGEFQMHVEPDETRSDPAYWVYALWPALDVESKPARVIIQLTRSVYFHHNGAAMSEALLISGLREHELRATAEKSNARLELEIAERMRVETALQEAQGKLRADANKLEQVVADRTAQLRASVGELEAFSYSLVHDLRAPVRAIQGFTHLALELSGESIPPAASEFLNRVIKASSRMDSLIQDVLSLHQVISQPIKSELIDTEGLLRTLIEERPELALFAANFTIETPLLKMRGHEATFSQCLTNLLGNAIKFVAPGKVPRVRIWTEKVGRPEVSEVSARGLPSRPSPSVVGSKVRLWVEDQGIGIALEEREKIFEIFERLNSSSLYEGSGIGLAIVRKAIVRMGGRVGVESEPGVGSRFWLELPGA